MHELIVIDIKMYEVLIKRYHSHQTVAATSHPGITQIAECDEWLTVPLQRRDKGIKLILFHPLCA